MISRAGKATSKNKYLMNVAMEEGDPFWLDFENGKQIKMTKLPPMKARK